MIRWGGHRHHPRRWVWRADRGAGGLVALLCRVLRRGQLGRRPLRIGRTMAVWGSIRGQCRGPRRKGRTATRRTVLRPRCSPAAGPRRCRRDLRGITAPPLPTGPRASVAELTLGARRALRRARRTDEEVLYCQYRANKRNINVHVRIEGSDKFSAGLRVIPIVGCRDDSTYLEVPCQAATKIAGRLYIAIRPVYIPLTVVEIYIRNNKCSVPFRRRAASANFRD